MQVNYQYKNLEFHVLSKDYFIFYKNEKIVKNMFILKKDLNKL